MKSHKITSHIIGRNVISLYGGPGSGKSTTASGLFHLMKLAKIPCELVLEYAKDMTYSKRQEEMSDQIYIFAKQNKRIEDIHRYDPNIIVITDSPIKLGVFYGKDKPYVEELNELILAVHNTRNNTDILINRVKTYNPSGRNQTEEESNSIQRFLEKTFSYDLKIDGDENAPQKILDYVQKML